jgi:hypothetical protein
LTCEDPQLLSVLANMDSPYYNMLAIAVISPGIGLEEPLRVGTHDPSLLRELSTLHHVVLYDESGRRLNIGDTHGLLPLYLTPVSRDSVLDS